MTQPEQGAETAGAVHTAPAVSSEPYETTGNIERYKTWAGINSGARVFVTDERYPQLRKKRLEFICLAVNKNTRQGWAEVYGGPRGGMLYAINTDFIVPCS